MTPEISFAPARPADAGAIKQLLIEAGLPAEDFANHLSHFLVASQNDRLTGAIGLEPCGETGLLRSLVVAPASRGRGLGQKLCEQMLAVAHRHGLREVYLLTTTAAGFFPRLGFKIIDRTDVPPAIRVTAEFASICPASAVCMVKKII